MLNVLKTSALVENKHEPHKIHFIFQLLLFPEGTRFTTKKHEASLEFAVKNNLPQLKHHLLPRTRGFIASLPSMKGKVPALYELELAFKEDAPVKPTIRNLLLGRPLEAHYYMRRIPMEEVPMDPSEQEKFLREIFVRKVMHIEQRILLEDT